MKEKMNKMGYTQGDMKTHVEDYQRPAKDFAESGFSKTLEYIERNDAYVGKEASEIKKQHYKGRYS